MEACAAFQRVGSVAFHPIVLRSLTLTQHRTNFEISKSQRWQDDRNATACLTGSGCASLLAATELDILPHRGLPAAWISADWQVQIDCCVAEFAKGLMAPQNAIIPLYCAWFTRFIIMNPDHSRGHLQSLAASSWSQ